MFFLIILLILGSEWVDSICTIPKHPLSELKDVKIFPDLPIVFVEDGEYVGRQAVLQAMVAQEYLSNNYGNTVALLSSSNAYSHGRIHMTLNEYFDHILFAHNNHSKANETYYLFGGNYGDIWDTMSNAYAIPPCKYCDVGGAVTVGIGGSHSGVAFHLHGPGFSETIIGSKQWFVFSNQVTHLVRRFDANLTMSEWTHRIYPCLSTDCATVIGIEEESSGSLFPFSSPTTIHSGNTSICGGCLEATLFTPGEWKDLRENFFECVLSPGEVLFFPSMWMHATLNLEVYNYFVSVFLDPQLMKE